MTSDPLGLSARTNPLQLYEVLSVVFGFLDRPSLLEAGLVCSSWHTCSQEILQQTCVILNQDVLGFFSPPAKFDVSFKTHLHAARFVKTCHRVKSLRVGSILKRHGTSGGPFDFKSAPLLQRERLSYLFQLYRAYQVHPGLKNLVHLDIHFSDSCFSYTWGNDDEQADFYAIMYGLILDNEHLRDLEFTNAGSGSVSTIFKRLCDLKVAHRVQRLSIKTDASHFPFHTLLRDLSNANEEPSADGADEQEPGAGAKPWTLQELVLQSVRSRAMGRFSIDVKAASAERYPVIRSLTMLGFALYRTASRAAEAMSDTASETEEDDGLHTAAQRIDPKLYLLQQFPNLERLRISHDLSPISESSPKSFSEGVLSLVPDLENARHFMEAPENFVEEMAKACPKLKAIDLGGNVDLSESQWEEMMRVYGRQLESLVVWGVLNFSAAALMHVIEPPPLKAIPEPSGRFGMSSRLTELDISWAGVFGDCAWLVFSTLPCLKHFKARQVPLDAARLVGYDWVCKDLETLAIQVLVPMQKWPLEPLWVGDGGLEPLQSKESHTGDAECPLCARVQKPETSTSPASKKDDDDDDGEDDGYAEKFASKRARVQEGDKERKRAKKAKKAKKEHKQTDTDSVTEQSQSTDTISQNAFKESEPSRPYHFQVQVDLCEQLGRLHRLRELTLEGQRDCWYGDHEWDCLHLTLQTGLDRLEGLQNSLEKLVLYQLQDELAGDEEVEWIAQHWIHHRNPVWQQEYRRRKQLHNGILGDVEKDVEDDLWRPEPKFKALLGVGVRNTSSYSSARRAHANLAWLKQECPGLRIEKDHRILDEDFYVGSFEDF
ncbi:hypothetical protein BGZ70_002382 [Mortierella alpina]|uniref:F-box domain-containing protein n=1 Tax=Mortierella alpina TaxID=64518 RepID=A0A9P6IUR5_MORAP|nr:hypothetical protein BGZ70_002382 [Mortierella alpina]